MTAPVVSAQQPGDDQRLLEFHAAAVRDHGEFRRKALDMLGLRTKQQEAVPLDQAVARCQALLTSTG